MTTSAPPSSLGVFVFTAIAVLHILSIGEGGLGGAPPYASAFVPARPPTPIPVAGRGRVAVVVSLGAPAPSVAAATSPKGRRRGLVPVGPAEWTARLSSPSFIGLHGRPRDGDDDDDNPGPDDDDAPSEYDPVMDELRSFKRDRFGTDMPPSVELESAAKIAEDAFLAAMLQQTGDFRTIKEETGSSGAVDAFMERIREEDLRQRDETAEQERRRGGGGGDGPSWE